MKRLVGIIILIVMVCTLTGCSTHRSGDTIKGFCFIKYFYTSPTEVDIMLVYDPTTKVVYYLQPGYLLCPYYLSNSEISIYGVNYFEN